MGKKKENKKVQKVKTKKDWNKILLITLLVLLIIEIILIPCLFYAEVKKVLGIIMFLILPTIGAIIVLLLSRICIVDFQKKKERLLNRN